MLEPVTHGNHLLLIENQPDDESIKGVMLRPQTIFISSLPEPTSLARTHTRTHTHARMHARMHTLLPEQIYFLPELFPILPKTNKSLPSSCSTRSTFQRVCGNHVTCPCIHDISFKSVVVQGFSNFFGGLQYQ